MIKSEVLRKCIIINYRTLSDLSFPCAYRLICTVVMATSSSSANEVNKKQTVPYSAVPTTISTPDLMPTDFSIVDSTVPCSAIDSRSFASTGASFHCSVPEVSSDEDECPLSAIDVEEIVSEDSSKNSKFRKSNDGYRLKPKKYKVERVVPNAFVALPVKSVGVCSQIEHLHRHLILKEPKIHNVLVPINRMHITLMVMKLDSDDDIKRCVTKWMFLQIYCIL